MNESCLPLLDHFQACVDAAFLRAKRLETAPRHPVAGCLAPLETPERWMRALQRVQETLQTRYSVDQITPRHLAAWGHVLESRAPLTATRHTHGDPINPLDIDQITRNLIRITDGSLVLATPVIPWFNRLLSFVRLRAGRDPDDRAWQYWRYGDITHWLAGTNTNPTPVEHSLVLLVSVLLTHLGEELKAGHGVEGAAHWLHLLDALGDGIVPLAFHPHHSTITLARLQDLA